METIARPPEPYYNATVTVAYGAELADLHERIWTTAADKYMWIYTLDIDYLNDLIELTPRPYNVYAIVDYRARHHAANLSYIQPRFKARSWSWNRTLHAKGLIEPATNLLWTTSANCNRASHLHGRNIATLTHSPDATQSALRHWTDAWQRSSPIAPSSAPPRPVAKLK